ncbi:MAG: class II aldolase/adducin family protein [Candidatus Altiarchaeota archaeon]
MDSEEKKLRGEVLKAAKAIHERGLVETGEGNVSVRVPDREELYITPTFNDYGKLIAEDIVRIRFDGTQVSKGRKPSSEYRLHAAVYRAKPKAKCVIHTHSPYATMLSAAREKIPVLLEEMAIFLGGEVNVSEYAEANTEKIGAKAVKALGNRNGTLLANHGALVCGRTVEHTVKMAELVEKMAKVYVGAKLIGKPHKIPQKNLKKFLQKHGKDFSTL